MAKKTADVSSEVAALLGGSGASNTGQVLSDAAKNVGGSNVAAGGNSQVSALSGQLTTIAQQLQTLQTINQSQIEKIQANTNAVSQNTTAKSSGSSTASSIGRTFLDTLGIGTGLSPLISGLIGLFGGGSDAPAQTFTPFIQALPVKATEGISSASATGPFGVDFAQGGQPRPVTSAAAAQITVQVQAMDSQSFLDRSNDIAAAVRKAMLETTTLNDVIREV
jgi:hypothetical protein